MKICFISDTHDQHDRVKVPAADILIHTGDLTMSGDVASCRKALQWLNAQPHEYIIVIAGNHDFAFESEHKNVLLLGLDRLTYLENSGTEVKGLKIWGSPVQPWFHDWAFNIQRGEPIKKYWNEIPEGLDVLITHGPPWGKLDQVIPDRTDHLGCEELEKRVHEVKPKIHAFGHIHGGYGTMQGKHTKFVNSSLLNEAYQFVNEPIVIEYE